ncbi:MAG: hypothetical protein NC905_06870 [Candidatus Omnitrophica bacterium]|nr:hypothetical protein [Candidatus Omnitrophota bacterium]
MGDFNKHIAIAKEKLNATMDAYEKKLSTVVGDLAIKVVEHLVEADAAKNNRHFGDHMTRQEYSQKNFPKDINIAMRKVWFGYGDLGYDGINGKRAKTVINNLQIIVKFFEIRFSIKLK